MLRMQRDMLTLLSTYIPSPLRELEMFGVDRDWEKEKERESNDTAKEAAPLQLFTVFQGQVRPFKDENHARIFGYVTRKATPMDPAFFSTLSKGPDACGPVLLLTKGPADDCVLDKRGMGVYSDADEYPIIVKVMDREGEDLCVLRAFVDDVADNVRVLFLADFVHIDQRQPNAALASSHDLVVRKRGPAPRQKILGLVEVPLSQCEETHFLEGLGERLVCL